jgi:uncharacterized membrane protein
MGKGRLEAFSDGVFAIIITIMVLELKVPHGTTLAALLPLSPVFVGYVLSYVYVGIYWNNHHHLLQNCSRVTGGALWANLFLLFWLSLVPFVTGWVGENDFAALPLACYGVVLLMCGISFFVLEHFLSLNNETLKRALGRDLKGKLSILLYLIGIVLSYQRPLFGFAVYVLVAMIWFIPDRRLERGISNRNR